MEGHNGLYQAQPKPMPRVRTATGFETEEAAQHITVLVCRNTRPGITHNNAGSKAHQCRCAYNYRTTVRGVLNRVIHQVQKQLKQQKIKDY